MIAPALIVAASLAAVPIRVYPLRVVDCHDGDTCTARFLLTSDAGLGVTLSSEVLGTIRLCDIDTPEIRPLETREAATVSRDALLAKVRGASKLVAYVVQRNLCMPDEICDKKDSFGRWLVYLIADGVNLNQWMLDQKLATLHNERCTLTPP